MKQSQVLNSAKKTENAKKSPIAENADSDGKKTEEAESCGENGVYCCAPKKHIMDSNSFTNMFEIVPRVIIIKKDKLRLHKKYEKNVKIKNIGLYVRRIDFGTDCEDTTINIEKKLRHRYIEPDETFNITVNVDPKTKSIKNKRRHVYFYLMHPNIVFEVPIIVLGSIEEPLPSLPNYIIFRPTAPNNITCFEFIIYNPWNESFATKVMTSCKKIKLVVNDKLTPKHNFIKIVVFLCVTSLEGITNILKIKFGKAPVLEIPINHTPVPIDCHLSVSQLSFEELKFSRTAEKEFLICNDSEQKAEFELYLISEDEYETDLSAVSAEMSLRKSLGSVELLKQYGSKQSIDSSETESYEIENATESQISSRLDFFARDSKHFEIQKLCYNELTPNSIQKVIVTFQPKLPDVEEFDSEPPFTLRTKIVFISRYLDYEDKKFIILTGSIRGPEIEIQPQTIDLRRIFLGEEHCVSFQALNVDGMVNAKVFVKDHDLKDMISLNFEPTEISELQPCQRCKFNFSIYATAAGKIIFKIIFKVQNGATYSVIITGISQTLTLKTFPNLIEFGNIPIAVPQKRYILVMNPCSVPITAQITPAEDGDEIPLVLKIDDISEPLPITVRDPIRQFKQAVDDENFVEEIENEEKLIYKDVLEVEDFEYEDEISTSNMSLNEIVSDLTFHSLEEQSEYSMEFVMEVIDPMYDLARVVLSNIKKKRILEKNEIEKRTITEALNALLSQKYFNKMDVYKNYAFMDWNALPTDPKELYCDNEVLYLLPNTGKKITVLLIPNKCGYYNRSLTVRVCPLSKQKEYDDLKGNYENIFSGSMVGSDVMVSHIMLDYNCTIPSFLWNSEIFFTEIDVYTGQPYFFSMYFKNESQVGGFVFYEVVPQCEDGFMNFIENIWKFYVEPKSTTYINCNVEFCKTGHVKLYGLVRFLGSCCPSVFTISAFVKPSRLNGLPTSIELHQRICENKRIYVYLENATPALNSFKIFLEKETNGIYVYPHGYQLSANKQGMYLTINSFFRDPGRYQNTLYIQMRYSTILEVPIIFNVEGTPVFFKPPIKQGFDMGNLFIVTEYEFNSDDPKYISELIVKNCGNRVYHVNITKIKTNVGIMCAPASSSARIDVCPKNVSVKPKSELLLQITGIAFEEQFVQNEFRVQIVDGTKPKRFENIRLLVKARFLKPKIIWLPNKLNLQYERTHIFKEHPIVETVIITNGENADVEWVRLNCLGPFKIKEYFEDPFEKEISFSLCKSEQKELTVMVHKEALKNLDCHKLKGQVFCSANNIVQKCLNVTVTILTPKISILLNELVLFVNKQQSETVIELKNIGCVNAEYKWKKIDEQIIYVEKEDDEREFARDLLSDILQMLDLSDSIPEEIENENLSERYRRYRCRLQRLEDEIGIGVIIDEIIENLDLEHKRFIIHWDEQQIGDVINDIVDEVVYDICKEEIDCRQCAECCSSAVSTSKRIARETLHEILRKLKIEDSYDVTEPSSSYCSAERFAYFYEKWSTVKVNEKKFCVIHLPGVRKGYEQRVTFELEVIGGENQLFTLILVNLNKTIELSRHHVYLGIRPWYETYKANVRATNVTPYFVNVVLSYLDQKPKPRHRLIDGYMHLKSEKVFEISEHGNKLIKTEGVLGLRYTFSRELQLIINGGDQMRIKFQGQGVMPIFSMVTKLLHVKQDEEQIYEEYVILQRIFYFDIFKQYIEYDEEVTFTCEEEWVKNKIDEMSDLSESINTIGESDIEYEEEGFDDFCKVLYHQKKWKYILDTYVFINFQDVPNGLVLQQIIETEKFLVRLNTNSEIRELLTMVYREFIKHERTHDDLMPLNVKHFAIQPLPFEMHGFNLNMNLLKLGVFQKFEFTLQFFGPGKLIAQVRIPVCIPGMFISLYTEKAPADISFLYYKPEQKQPDIFVKPYRNMWERIMDAENDPKLKHAHSFDIDRRQEHLRDEITPIDRKIILNYYNSLNKSVYMEHKHHYILNKVLAHTKHNFSGTLLHVVVLIKPEAKYYKHGQIIEDIMYIDLHMGPMLPITLHGQIKAR